MREQGLEILAQNVDFEFAELDIVARDREQDGSEVRVFVEVRSRRHARRGAPEETIGASKQARVRKAATAYLVREGLWEKIAVRFDVVAIVEEPPELRWFRNAF